MQFGTPKESSNSVVLKYTDPESIRAAVENYAEALKSKHSHIQRIIWFGSWINGTYSPGSDVDICIVVSRSNMRPHERAPQFLPDKFPVGMDIHVYTEQEFEKLKTSAPQMHECIAGGSIM